MEEDPHDAYDFNSKPIKKKSLKLPKGKKPLILSIDDFNGNHPIIIAFGLIRFTSKRHFRIRN
jgi:hypothetical protein